MSPRPQKVSDDQIFEAARRAMARLGPGELTLAAVGAGAGVTAGALVQRFGSKRALLLALAERASGAADGYLEEIALRHASPLAALRAYADCMAGLGESPAAFARGLAYLQIDLSDEDFRRHLAAQARATRSALERLLAAAVAKRELLRTAAPAALARLVETVLSGSLLTWATYREGPASAWLRTDLDAALAPYLARGSRRGAVRRERRQ